MRYISLLIAVLIVINCNNDSTELQAPHTDILTLEMSFGAENLPEEFILSRPTDVKINNDGDIFVADEKFIKVFDSTGQPKGMIGGNGNGPGEFGTSKSPLSFTIGHYGFISVIHNGIVHLFEPPFSYSSTSNFLLSDNRQYLLNRLDLTRFDLQKMVTIDKDSRVFSGNDEDREFLVYANNSILNIIAEYPISTLPKDAGGSLIWDILPGGKVFYTHSGTDISNEADNHIYSIIIYDYNTSSKVTLDHDFKPVDYPNSIYEGYAESMHLTLLNAPDLSPEIVQMAESRLSELKRVKYYVPVQEILTDGDFLFAFTYSVNDNGEILCNVFDTQTGLYVTSVYFPFIPSSVKNGYVYTIKQGADVFPEVEKYKIDLSAYRK